MSQVLVDEGVQRVGADGRVLDRADTQEIVSDRIPTTTGLSVDSSEEGKRATPTLHPPAPHHLDKPDVTIVPSG